MEPARSPWQEVPRLLFEYFATLEDDGASLLRNSSQVCSHWRALVLDVVMNDTGTSRPAGWRKQLPPLAGAAAAAEAQAVAGHSPSPVPEKAGGTSRQAAMVGTDSVNACVGGKNVSLEVKKGIESELYDGAAAGGAAATSELPSSQALDDECYMTDASTQAQGGDAPRRREQRKRAAPLQTEQKRKKDAGSLGREGGANAAPAAKRQKADEAQNQKKNEDPAASNKQPATNQESGHGAALSGGWRSMLWGALQRFTGRSS